MDNERSEVAFFDIETTVPTRPGQGFAILEFGAILVCPRKLTEQEAYSTLVRPTDLDLLSTLSVRRNGISPEAVTCAPTFSEIADKVYDILHGRIWAGHNIVKFDCHRIKEAFAGINRPAPEPKGIIDTLALLTQRFGRRAGDMKMASLATYFGLGQQTHRSLDDVRMNLEVLKYCATVLLLESSLPEIFTENSWVSPNAITRSRSSGRVIPQETSFGADTPPSSVRMESHLEFSAKSSITRSLTSGRAIPEETGFSTDTPSSSVWMESQVDFSAESSISRSSTSGRANPEETGFTADTPSSRVRMENHVESTAENAVTRSRTRGRIVPLEMGFSADTPSSSVNIESHVESSAENAITRSRTSGIAIPEKTSFGAYTPSLSVRMERPVESTPENVITRSRTSSRGRAILEETGFGADTPSSNIRMENHVESTEEINPFNMVKLEESLLSDELEDEATSSYFPGSPTSTATEFIGCSDFLEPNEISIPSVSVSLAPFYHGSQKIQVLHDYGELQVCCRRMKVRFGIGKKYFDKAGRPRLSFVVDASSELCQILDAVDNLAQKLSMDSGSSSEWRSVVTRKPGFMNYPTVRLNLPTVVDGNVSRWATEIYQKESSTTQKIVFGRFDVEELEFLITPGTLVDAYFSMDSYDFQQKAGIRLVAEKLVVHST